jgi:hypothetical protein
MSDLPPLPSRIAANAAAAARTRCLCRRPTGDANMDSFSVIMIVAGLVVVGLAAKWLIESAQQRKRRRADDGCEGSRDENLLASPAARRARW